MTSQTLCEMDSRALSYYRTDTVAILSANGSAAFKEKSFTTELTQSQSYQPMAAQLSKKKAALPLAKILVTASCRTSKTGPWSLEAIVLTMYSMGPRLPWEMIWIIFTIECLAVIENANLFLGFLR